MNTHEKDTFLRTYEWANSWRDLPWAHTDPTLFLSEICRTRKPGRVLDIGCGAGVDSVYMAAQGWEVTSLDFVPKALEFTQDRAADAGVSVTPVVADITTWEPPYEYDLVLDHGLLHNMDTVRYDAYRQVLMKALGGSGEFVLLHWHPLYPGQKSGEQGPLRVSREAIKTFFAPELQEHFFAVEHFESLPSIVGGGMAQAYYWFKPNRSWQDSAGLIEQIKTTLTNNDVDADAALAGTLTGNTSNDLLADVLGPGRLGLRHDVQTADAVPGIIQEIAESSGIDVAAVENILKVFTDADSANICTDFARCAVCEVSYCKRKSKAM
jgi:SAM-dependent methyltransferase